MADALHAVIAATENYGLQAEMRSFSGCTLKRLRQAADPFSNRVRSSTSPALALADQPRNAPEPARRKPPSVRPGSSRLQLLRRGIAWCRHYFTAVYAEPATVNACADCHNRNPGAPKKDFKVGDVMGGLVVRVPLEF